MDTLIDNKTTDKNTTHSYLEIYEQHFAPIRSTCKNLLEIGVQQGGSIKLWKDYFENATIYGFDVDLSTVKVDLSSPRIRLTRCDAYLKSSIEALEGTTFSVIIDDGPHTLESMLFVATEYSKHLDVGGILVIEDIQSANWLHFIRRAFPDYMTVEVVDRRSVKDRYDDIMVIAKRS